MIESIEDIFDVVYPLTMVLSKQAIDDKGVNFVSAKGRENGVAAKIAPNAKHKIYPAGSITVSMKGGVLSAFVQPEDFYIAHQIAVLTPKQKMSLSEKLFYCLCIEKNKYRFNYGRQADKTLRGIGVPSRKSIPPWVVGAYESTVESTAAFIKRMSGEDEKF